MIYNIKIHRNRTDKHCLKALFSWQDQENTTKEIPRIRSESIRLNNFVSQNYSLTDLSFQKS
jgi:hypothetical protein